MWNLNFLIFDAWTYLLKVYSTLLQPSFFFPKCPLSTFSYPLFPFRTMHRQTTSNRSFNYGMPFCYLQYSVFEPINQVRQLKKRHILILSHILLLVKCLCMDCPLRDFHELLDLNHSIWIQVTDLPDPLGPDVQPLEGVRP